MFNFFVNKITFSGGQDITLKPNSLNILIGPNSSGKSTALSNIATLTDAEQHNKLAVKATSVKYDNENDFNNWIKSSFFRVTRAGKEYIAINGNLIPAYTPILFASPPNYGALIHFLQHHLNTSQRLEIGNPQKAINLESENPQYYIHLMQLDDTLQKEISSLVKDAFGEELLIDWTAGSKVNFRVGQEPPRSIEADRVSSTYRQAIGKLPMLQNMGDGIRSYVGALLAIKCGNYPVLLIDEPEAFLHPQQIRKMGALLAKSARDNNRQIIVATHSSAIIRGALSANGNISIIRVEREGNINNGYLLNSDDIQTLWAKPLLKSSGAIAGIFHEGVIVCEGDADCRFYEAIQNRMEDQEFFTKPIDLYYVHGGTKGEIATLTRSYKALNVKTAAIVDFDILQNEQEFRILCAAMKINFNLIQAKYNSSKSSLDELPPIKDVKTICSGIDDILKDALATGSLESAHKKEINSLLRDAAKWSTAKQLGITKLRGGTYSNCQQMLEICAQHGLFIVPNGELESWWRAGPGEKNEWAIKALDQIKEGLPFTEAEDLVTKVCEFMGITKRG